MNFVVRITFLCLVFAGANGFGSDDYKFSYENLTKSYLELYLNLYNEKYDQKLTYEQALTDLKKLAEEAKQKAKIDENEIDIAALKTAVESILNERHIKNESIIEGTTHHGIVYNKDFNNLFEYLYEGKMQCDSGTQLLLTMHRLLAKSRAVFQKNNPMAIYQSGHILYGELKQIKDGLQLIGYETTADGPAKRFLGLTNELQVNRDVSYPVEAEFYMATKITQGKERKKLKNIADERMSLIYGVKIAELQKRIKELNLKFELWNYIKEGIKALKSGIGKGIGLGLSAVGDIFSFGSSNTPSGDLARTQWKTSDLRTQLFLHLYHNRVDSDFQYSSEQKDVTDIEGNNPFLYYSKYGSDQETYFSLQRLYRPNWPKVSKKVSKSQMEILKQMYETGLRDFCRQSNFERDSILTALTKNTNPEFAKINEAFFKECLELYPVDYLTKTDSFGQNFLHVAILSLAKTHEGWGDAHYKVRYATVRNILKNSEDINKIISLMTKPDIYKESPLQVLVNVLSFEDNAIQREYLLKTSRDLIEYLSDSQKICILPELKWEVDKIRETEEASKELAEMKNTLLERIEYCEPEVSVFPITHQGPEEVHYLIQEYNETGGPKSYEKLKQAINKNYVNSDFSAFPINFEGKDTIQAIVSSYVFDEDQKIELIKQIKELRPDLFEKNLNTVNVFNSNPLTYACLYEQTKLLELLESLGYSELLTNTGNFSCVGQYFITEDQQLKAHIRLLAAKEQNLMKMADWTGLYRQFVMANDEASINEMKSLGFHERFLKLDEIIKELQDETVLANHWDDRLLEVLKNEPEVVPTNGTSQYKILIHHMLKKSFLWSHFEVFEKYTQFVDLDDVRTLLKSIDVETTAQLDVLQKYAPDLNIRFSNLKSENCELMKRVVNENGVSTPSVYLDIPDAGLYLVQENCLTDSERGKVVAAVKLSIKEKAAEQDKGYEAERIYRLSEGLFENKFPNSQNFINYQKLISSGIVNLGYAVSCYRGDYADSLFDELFQDGRTDEEIRAFFSLNPPVEIECLSGVQSRGSEKKSVADVYTRREARNGHALDLFEAYLTEKRGGKSCDCRLSKDL